MNESEKDDLLARWRGAVAASAVAAACDELRNRWRLVTVAEGEAAQRWLAGEDLLYAVRRQRPQFGGLPVILVS